MPPPAPNTPAPVPPIARVVLIDDDDLMRMVAAASLAACGFRVEEHANGEEGLAAIRRDPPELVLLDVVMPGIDGFEVCRQMRDDPALLRVPVMMLTGRGDGAAIEAAYRAGATDFVTKPINPVLLGHRAKYVLRAAATLEEVERHRASLANAERLARLGSWSWRQRSSRFEFSDQYREITGDSGESTGMPFERRLASVHPEDRERVRQAYSRVTGAAEPCSVVFRLRQDGSDGPLVHEQVEIVRDVSGAILRYEGAIQDITERVATEERIRQLADYDGLTRLANRRLFVEVMRNGLAQARRRGVSAAVLDINLDRFKRINETLGDASSGPQASTESTGDRTASPRQAGVSTGSMAPNQRTRISSSRTRSKGLVG